MILACAGAARADQAEAALDRINMAVNWRVAYDPMIAWSNGQRGNCTTYALQKYEAAKAAGFDPATWGVTDPYGHAHAVVPVGDWVLDSEQEHVERRATLEKHGYRFDDEPVDPLLIAAWAH